ncbi:DUF1499 domain-containing protein [Mesorhizobium sp. SP-1A]|uniref:DUF1499 domain-containing protein n=1 Tax=Mesorhizobium sp. SP-1A TaxID=3077840 RepID=UPI0028F719AC|nr:DUF1499 domain-containing protein [Mesorhizobium sp. SP-1A]
MTEYPERQVSRAAGWARGIGAFSLVLLVTDWVGHHFGLTETPAFLWVLGLAALLAALALLLAGLAFARMWKYGALGGRDLTIGALLAALVLVPYGFVAYRMLAYPLLRDISTDQDDPPALEASLRTGVMNPLASPTPGEVRLQSEAYPLVIGHRYDLPFDETLDAVETVVNAMGWQPTAPLPSTDDARDEATVTVLARSFILDLPCDVAIRVAADGESTIVDMRSSSRYGRHDLGDNAARVIAFMTELDKEISARTGTAPDQ